MNELKVISTAGLLTGLVSVLSVFDVNIDVPKQWWMAIPDLLLGVVVGSAIHLVERRLIESNNSILSTVAVYTVFSAVGMFVSVIYFPHPSIIALLGGIFLSLVILFPALDSFNDK